jgi:hypothetical protein
MINKHLNMAGLENIVRSLSELRDRTLIKHHIGPKKSTRICVVNAPKGVVEYEGKEYSLNQFVLKHYADVHPIRKTADAWKDCRAQFGTEWKSLYKIPKP